jgi:tetratricopeptide (TPR) repeat protein
MLRASSVDFESKKDITMGYGLLEKTSEGPSLEDSLLNIRSQRLSNLTQSYLNYKRDELGNVIRSMQDNVNALLQLGDVHLIKKDYYRARRIFSDIIKIKNDFYAAYEKLILVNLILNQFDEVEKIYKRYIQISNRRNDILHNYVLFKLFYKGVKDENNRAECLDILQEIMAKDSKNIFALNTYGFILLNNNQLEESKDYFLKSLEIKSDFIHANNNLGVYFLRKKDIKNAEIYFRKVLSSNINFLPAHENLLQIMFLNKEFKNALKYINTINKTKLILPIKWKGIIGTMLAKQSKFPEAADTFLDYLKEDPENFYILNNLGFCYFAQNKIKEAESYLKQSYAISKNRGQLTKNPLVFYNLGKLFLAKTDLDKVKDIADQILYYFPNDPFGFYFLASVLIKKEKFEDARSLLYRALEGHPNIEEIYTDLGFILSAIERKYEEALRIMNIAFEKGIASPLTLNNMAYAFAKMGKLKEAEEIMMKIKEPVPAVCSATKGLIAIRQGLIKKGEELYLKTIRKLQDRNLKTIARQILNLEKARYFITKEDNSKAKYHLKYALKLGNTYVNPEIAELLKQIT